MKTDMPAPNDLITDDTGCRCWWCGSDADYIAYHDNEWGMPVDDDQRLFEKICLEGFQAGLSWLTILRKRENFRRAFDGFDFPKVASFSSQRVDKLVQDAGIIRHRGKIESTINNARRAIEMVETHGSLARFFWSFEPEPSQSVIIRKRDQVVATTVESTRLAKTLKKAGWSFVGPTTCYAFMQSMGMVNDHLHQCDSWCRVDEARERFVRPTVP